MQHVLNRQTAELSEKCELPSGEPYTITAYVNARGRVVAAGVTSSVRADSEPGVEIAAGGAVVFPLDGDAVVAGAGRSRQ